MARDAEGVGSPPSGEGRSWEAKVGICRSPFYQGLNDNAGNKSARWAEFSRDGR